MCELIQTTSNEGSSLCFNVWHSKLPQVNKDGVFHHVVLEFMVNEGDVVNIRLS